jgi:hypothetical protein
MPNPAHFPHGRVLVTAACIDDFFDPKKQYMNDYKTSQLFSMYPLSPLPQQISHFEFEGPRRCLTVGKVPTVQASTHPSTYHVEMAECYSPSNKQLSNQLFTVHMLKSDDEARLFKHTPAMLIWSGSGDAALCLALDAPQPAGGASLPEGVSQHATVSINRQLAASPQSPHVLSAEEWVQPVSDKEPVQSSDITRQKKPAGRSVSPVRESPSYSPPQGGPPQASYSTLQPCYETVDGVAGAAVSASARLYLERSVIKSVTI